MTARRRLVCLLAVLVVTSGCGVHFYGAGVKFRKADYATLAASGTAEAKALAYLAATQIVEPEHGLVGGDWTGNWPQYMTLFTAPYFRVRDVSPFAPALVHQALTVITEESVDRLGLGPEHAIAARDMRRRAVGLMRRFASPEGAHDAGAYGYWPSVTEDWPPPQCLGGRILAVIRGDFLLSPLVHFFFEGPRYKGSRRLATTAGFPATFMIPSDADDDVNIMVALLNDKLIDGGPGPDRAIDDHICNYRDDGSSRFRFKYNWLPHASGAFLTFFGVHYNGDNELDLGVNANVLYGLGRFNRLDAAGAADAIKLINHAVCWPRDKPRSPLCFYYDGNLTLHHFVARAYAEGGVSALKPALERLVEEVEGSVQHGDGVAWWDFGAPPYDTACAILTLINAGRDSELIGPAAEFLRRSQNAENGSWPETEFCRGPASNGYMFLFRTKSVVTATCLQALCRARVVLDSRAQSLRR